MFEANLHAEKSRWLETTKRLFEFQTKILFVLKLNINVSKSFLVSKLPNLALKLPNS